MSNGGEYKFGRESYVNVIVTLLISETVWKYDVVPTLALHDGKLYNIFAPERSGGASYSESGVSNDQVSVCPMSVCTSGKSEANYRSLVHLVKWPILSTKISVDFQGAEKNCGFAAKERFAGTLKKSTFFDFLIIKIVLTYPVLDRSEAHSSRPRTYLPSRSGATHALRQCGSNLVRKPTLVFERNTS